MLSSVWITKWDALLTLGDLYSIKMFQNLRSQNLSDGAIIEARILNIWITKEQEGGFSRATVIAVVHT